MGETAPTRTVPGFRGPPRGPADLRIEGSEAGPKTIPGGGPGTALEPRDTVPPLVDARAAGHSPCSPRRTSKRGAWRQSMRNVLRTVARPGDRARGRRDSSSLLRGGRHGFQRDCGCARSAPPSVAMHQSAPPPGQAPPRRPSRPKTAGNLAQELESGSAWILPPPPRRPKERPLLPGEGRAKDAPGKVALP